MIKGLVISSPSFFEYNMDFQVLKKIIEDNDSFLITTHVNPDADAIGSEIALHIMLNKLGKKSYIINHSYTPYYLQFLDPENIIKKFNPDTDRKYFDEADVLIGLDFNRLNRLVSMEKVFSESKKIKVCIDHHQDSEDFVSYSFDDDQYSATGHIIYDFIKKTGIVKLDYDIAYPLYAAIMTDTGSFRFERTNAELHRIIASLLDLGVDPVEVYDKIYDQSKLSKIQLLGRALDSIKLVSDNRIGYMFLTREDIIKYVASESDTDGFVNYTLSIENVVLGMFFIELKNGFKVSFRSKGKIPVDKLAAKFGGGGHINAAGVRFRDLSMDKEMKNILETAEKFLINNYQE